MNTSCYGFHDGTVPNCLFGDCVSYSCVCWSGFRDDKVVGHYHNCGMNVIASYVLASLSALVNIFAFIFGLYVSRFGCEKGTDAQKICYVVSISGLSFFAANITLLGMDFIMPVWGAMFVNVGMASVALACGIVVHSAAKPVALFMHYHHLEKIEIVIIKVIPSVLLIAGTLCTIVGHAIGTDKSISTAIAACYVVILFCSICYLPTFSFLSALLRGLEQAIDRNVTDPSSSKDAPARSISMRISTAANQLRVSMSTIAANVPKAPYLHFKEGSQISLNDSPEVAEQKKKEKMKEQNQRKIRKFRAKVIFMRFVAALACSALAVLSITAGVLDFGFGTLPFSGYLFFALSLGIGAFSVQMAHYSWTSAGKKDNSTGDDDISSEKRPASGRNNLKKRARDSSFTNIGTFQGSNIETPTSAGLNMSPKVSDLLSTEPSPIRENPEKIEEEVGEPQQ